MKPGIIILIIIIESAGVISYIPLLDDPGKELLGILQTLVMYVCNYVYICSAILESFVVGKPSKSIGRRTSRTPQTTTKIMSGGKGRRK